MLSDAPVMISFSVDDMKKAKQFYHEALGLEVDDSMGMLELKLRVGGKVMLYEKDTHKPASYTLINFQVDDLAAAMKEMKGRGVKFEHYDSDDMKTDSEGVNDFGMMKIAFFNDPAGNNHAVLQMTGK